MPHDLFAATLIVGLAICGQAFATDPVRATQTTGERSRTSAVQALSWRAPAYPVASVATLHYREMTASRLLDLQRKNARPGPKATQIGIGRRASEESLQSRRLPLTWHPVAGGAVARIEIRSTDALALRVGLDVRQLDDRIELRFGGSADRSSVVARMAGAQVKRLLGPEDLFWTPSTDGEAQIIEIYHPAGAINRPKRIEAPMLSHMIADSRSGFGLIAKIGESGACNIDTICREGELGQPFIDAKNATTHMQFIKAAADGYICSATLLADTVASTQIPYLHSAYHCFAFGPGLSPQQNQLQSVANSLNTLWNYEATGCGNKTTAVITRLTGGAAHLFSSDATDTMLLRLNDAAPAGAYFAGWNAGPVANNGNAVAIHHPRGDSKKVSIGRIIETNATAVVAGWSSGTTEGGSSGSGLFTLGPRGYVLRGGLYRGHAACSNSGTLSNPLNRDEYSRLEIDFPSIRAYLEPQPEAGEGARPIVRPRPAAKPATTPSASVTERGPGTIGRDEQRLRR